MKQRKSKLIFNHKFRTSVIPSEHSESGNPLQRDCRVGPMFIGPPRNDNCEIRVNSSGLLPVIIQEDKTSEVLMLGYMNKKALEETYKSGWVTFYSRSQKKLWTKGETSGNKLKILAMYNDCDNDTLLIKVKLIGKNVCHTGNKSCFYKRII